MLVVFESWSVEGDCRTSISPPGSRRIGVDISSRGDAEFDETCCEDEALSPELAAIRALEVMRDFGWDRKSGNRACQSGT